MALHMTAVNKITWHQLQHYMPKGARLTSCYRSSQQQLDFIVKTARAHGYSFSKTPAVGDESSWSGALKHVRKAGYKVAAPGHSAHQQGLAYDISGAELGQIEKAVRKAVADGLIRLVPGSKSGILREPENNCIHVEIMQVVLFDENMNSFAVA